MPIKIEKTFRVDVPIARTWAFLTKPENMVACIPGATLTELIDERSFTGKIAFKVGPIEARYEGEAHFEELDVANYRMRMVAKGVGDGRASMVMSGQLRALEDGGTESSVVAEVDLTGRLAQMGSRLIQFASSQMFDQFVKRVREQLRTQGA